MLYLCCLLVGVVDKGAVRLSMHYVAIHSIRLGLYYTSTTVDALIVEQVLVELITADQRLCWFFFIRPSPCFLED